MSKQDRIYPVDVFVYNHIKFFTEKGDGCCFQSNEKIASEIGRHKTNISRSISKLIRLGYVKAENENGRKLTTIADLNIKNIDNLATGSDNLANGNSDKLAMLVDILAMPCDNLAMDRVINSLRGSDNLAKHNIEYKLRYLNDNYFKKETKPDYAFRGEVIKLNVKDFDAWYDRFKKFDLVAELERLDKWCVDEKPSNWFIAVERALTKKNDKLADQPDYKPFGDWKDF